VEYCALNRAQINRMSEKGYDRLLMFVDAAVIANLSLPPILN